MIPLGINNKTYTNSKTRYRTNFIKILTIKKAVSHSYETAFLIPITLPLQKLITHHKIYLNPT